KRRAGVGEVDVGRRRRSLRRREQNRRGRTGVLPLVRQRAPQLSVGSGAEVSRSDRPPVEVDREQLCRYEQPSVGKVVVGRRRRSRLGRTDCQRARSQEEGNTPFASPVKKVRPTQTRHRLDTKALPRCDSVAPEPRVRRYGKQKVFEQWATFRSLFVLSK